jgi:hypothetical protein
MKMIATQRIQSVTTKPIPLDNYESINVLKWKNNKWKALCPYELRTDGQEECVNSGGILFENYYQGCKVYSVVYNNEVYPSQYQKNNPKYLWWKYNTINDKGDIILEGNKINYELYYRWRNSIWACNNPIRYPNGYKNKHKVNFTLYIDKNGTETRMNYITARKELYVKEYIRLVRKLPEYSLLLMKLKQGKNLMICEIDVPDINKKGHYKNDSCITHITIEKLELLMNDPSEAFGHGLCLCYALLNDLC